MSGQEEQLIELLLTLKKTTPAEARAILTSTPQIAYALVALMVKMNAMDVQVLQKTLTTFSSTQPPSQPQQAPAAPVSAIPPHLSQHRTPTPQMSNSQPYTPPPIPSHTPTPSIYSNGGGHTPQPHMRGGYGGQNTGHTGQNAGYSGPSSGYGTPAQPQGFGAGALPDALASIPDDQKAMIMRVISMTPEQINMLPPTERASILQLRATLGLPS
ncbi:hypothetical protein BJ138DRAFT_1123440 [Hygrophoropsis aurantiaca]|uniref:Uncharacterized protein n=1 Tax=Hygrophoropsis aurantiaca TaxID=72124 RepID=A0ACB8AP87_9AGAM|nr:hypothetical protein BJ138DRAFT_1123440 [Hygrophoropsis aurantiaca]